MCTEENDRTQNDVQVARTDGEILFYTEQIRADRGNHDTDPHRSGHTLFKKQAEDRHDDDVQRRQKTRLADTRVLNADLLQARRDGQCNTAEYAADPQRFPVILCRTRRLRGILSAAQKQNDRNERHRSDKITHAVKGERTDVIHTDALRNKGCAPNEGSQHQKQSAS